ncbi:MAG: hypothetical protein J6K04_11435 [Lachnospiraceae bacterium]|nr:hypothetical protein [Lachnospiraceae bacterium]
MISKAVRKMLALSLTAVMAVGAMAGCGSKDEGADPTKAPENDKVEATKAPDNQEEQPEATPTPIPEEYVIRTDANGNAYDLGGMEIIIRDWWANGERQRNNAYDEARWDYIEWAEETYNFTIKEQAIGDWGSNPNDFVDYATTGGDENYIFTLRQCGTVVSAMNSGLMYDLSTLDCLDFSEEKWSSNVHLLMQKGSAYYGMRGTDPEPRGCMYFNKRLLQEAGIDPNDLYKWQENGEWTWEKFEQVCEQVQRDTNADGVTDIYAMVQQGAEFHKQAVFANGGSFIDKDASGMFFNDLESAETIEALNWTIRMRNTYEMPQPEGSNWDFFYAEFKNGNAAFFTGQVYNAGQELKDMSDDFGCVVFPQGPSADKYIGFYEDNVYVIPACYDEDKAWKIAFAYDLYTQPITGFEDADTWKAGYYQNFRDTDSVDLTLARLVDGGSLMHHLMVSGIDLGNDILYNIGTANNEEGQVYTPAQKAEELREAWNAYINDANK